ncbi:MAG: hypothetical protein QM791_13850 [Ferruginibacter sp.]
MFKFLFVLLTCSMFSWSKPTGIATSSSQSGCLAGSWSALYLTDQVKHEPANIDFAFFNDGKVIIKSTGVKPAQETIYAAGEWSIEHNRLKITCKTLNYTSELVQKYLFTINKEGQLINGSWEDISDDQGIKLTGSFIEMKKQTCKENCDNNKEVLFTKE